MRYEAIKENLIKVYDELSPYWEEDFTLHDWGVEELQEFANQVKKTEDKRVVDLGCGSGVQSKLLIQEDLDVIGLDLSPKMVEAAKQKVFAGNFIVGDISNLPFKSESFGGVFSRASLLHIPKKQIPKVFQDINKILKDSGIFYLAVKEGEGESVVEDERHGQKVKRFFSLFGERELIDLLDKADFRVDKISKHKRVGGSTVWVQILARKT